MEDAVFSLNIVPVAVVAPQERINDESNHADAAADMEEVHEIQEYINLGSDDDDVVEDFGFEEAEVIEDICFDAYSNSEVIVLEDKLSDEEEFTGEVVGQVLDGEGEVREEEEGEQFPVQEVVVEDNTQELNEEAVFQVAGEVDVNDQVMEEGEDHAYVFDPPMAAYGEVYEDDEQAMEINNENQVNEQEMANDAEVEVCDYYENLFTADSIQEVALRTWGNTLPDTQHFLKGVFWSPDGSCCLVPVNAEGMHIINLPEHLWGDLTENPSNTELPSAVFVEEKTIMYDFAWYPNMSSYDRNTCCWIATAQMQPIHMYDAYEGRLLSSFRGYDSANEIEAAISCVFDPSGDHILAGYKKCLRVFDTAIAGAAASAYKVNKAVACLAPTINDCYFGTWDRQVMHIDLRTSHVERMFEPHHAGGITHMKRFDDYYTLYTGARKCDDICEWDTRFGGRPRRVLPRKVDTNQRIYFDTSPMLNYLVSGGTDGSLHIYETEFHCRNEANDKMVSRVQQISNDVLNGISFNPRVPILAVSSGQYHHRNHYCIEEESDPSSDAVEQVQKHVLLYENALSFLYLKEFRESDEERNADVVNDEVNELD